jgi:hypothetical protein
MATRYRVQGPDGAIHVLEGPDDASPEQVEAFAAQTIGKAAQKPAVEPGLPSIATPPGPSSGVFGGDDVMSTFTTPFTKTEPKSVMEGVKFDAPQVDYEENLRAMLKSGSPESVMYKFGRSKQQVDQTIAAGEQKQEKIAAEREKLRQAAKNEDYGFVDFAKDTGIDLSKGVVGLGESYVGLLDITSFGAAGRVLGNLGYDPKATNKFLTGFQSITRKNANADVEEAQGFIGTLAALAVNPTAIIGSVAESLPGTVASGAAAGQFVRFLAGKAASEAAVLGLTGQAAEAFITNKIKEQAFKIAAVAGGTEGAQSAGSIAEAGRQAGTDWSEYVAPSLAAGFGTAAIAAVSGKVGQKLGIGDIETSIATRSAGIRGIGQGEGVFVSKFLKEVAKEGFLEELPQSTQEQIFRNLATKRPWDENVGKAAAQGLVAGLAMAGGHSAGVEALQRTSSTIDKMAPGYALSQAMQADMESREFSPEAIRQEAVRRLRPDQAQMELVPEAGITSLRPTAAPVPPERPLEITPEAPSGIAPPVVEEAPQEPPQTVLPVAEEAPVEAPQEPMGGPAAPAAVETPTEELARQVLPDESQDYEAMIKELEAQMEGKPAPKVEAPTAEEPITTGPSAPVGGPAAPVKVAEPEAPPVKQVFEKSNQLMNEEVAKIDSAEKLAVEYSNIRQRKNPLSVNSQTDAVAMQGAFLERFADNHPEKAAEFAAELKADPEKYSDLSGISPDSVRAIGSRIDKRIAFNNEQAAKAPEPTAGPAAPTGGPAAPTKVAEPEAPTEAAAPVEAVAPEEEAAQPTPIGFRSANEQENKQDGARETLELGNGAKVLFASDGDTFVKDPTGKEAGVIRSGDTRRGIFQSASELPAYVPEAVRQPLMDYANAARSNYYSKSEQTQAALTDARAKLEAAVEGTKAQQTAQPTTGDTTTVTVTPEKPTGGPAAPAGPKAPKPPKVEVSEEEKAKAAEEKKKAEEEKAKAAEQKKKAEEFNKQPMKVAMEEGNADAVASILYGKTVPEDLMPVIFPDEMLLRIPVDAGNVSEIETALAKNGFRITDRSVSATTDDPSYTGPERITISALYKPEKISIQGGGAEFGGNRKTKVTAPPSPKDATDTQITKMLAAVAKDTLLNIHSNPDNTFGTMMYKEGIVSYVLPASDYMLAAIKEARLVRVTERTGSRQAIKMALENGQQDEIQKLLQGYVDALQGLQAVFDSHSRVGELDLALKEKYVKDETQSSSAAKYTQNGLDLRNKLKANNLPAIFNKMYQLFGANEDSTDQTNRVIKKETEVPPELGNIVRRGMRDHRQGRDVDVQDFVNAFGLFPGGVDFGNWVNQTERAAHLNAIYDAMYDLADVSGISPKMLGLGEKLKMAIGAQGRGGRTAAHYIPKLNEINLTKTKGDGSLGHEWQHALDWNLQQEANGKLLMAGTVEALKSSIDAEAVENNLKAILRDVANSSDNRNMPPKKAFFAAISNPNYYSQAQIYRDSYRPTQYLRDARALDEAEGRSPSYWSSNVELLSRAFESMLFDMSKGGSPYLVGPTVADGYISKKNGYGGTSYPAGKERPTLNEVYKQMLDQIDPETLEVKTYKMDTKIVQVEELGYAVLDQYNLDSGSRGGLVWFKDQKEAEEAKAQRDGQERVLTPEAMQLSKVNQRIIDMAKRVDAIMEEMGLFKWPEIKNGSMAESMFYHMRQGWWPKNNRELAEYGIKAYLQNPKLLGFDPAKDQREIDKYKIADFEGDRVKLKQTQEDFEAAAVRFVSQVITDMRAEGSDTKAIYDHIVGLYQTQPTLDVQSVLSKTNNAYSTPLPIGFLAGMLARVKSTTTVLDPTGGNGMLVVAANPQNVTTIELDPHRALNMELMQIGNVIEGDALEKLKDLRDQEVDVVLVNPPFGALSTSENVPSWTGQNYKIGTLDQLIAAKSLRAMANNGRAVLILGAHPKAGTITSTDRVFLNWLYGNYNVVDHYEIAGNLYRKQGASWPLRVLVIAGRNQTENAYPSDFNVNRITTFDELWSRYVQTSDRSQEVVVGTGKKQPITGGANRPAGGVPAGGTLEDGDIGGGVGAGEGAGVGEQLPTTGRGAGAAAAGGRGAAGAAGAGEQQPDIGKNKRGGPSSGEAGSSERGSDSGRGSEAELGGLSDLDLDSIFDELGKPEKVKGGPRAPRGAPKEPGAPRAPRAPTAKGPTVIPKELEGLGLESLLDELDVALNGKAPEVTKEVTAEDSQERLDKQANEAMGRIAQNTKNTSDDPNSGQYSRRGDQDYANVQPIIQKVWNAVGEKVSDAAQRIKQVYALLVGKFGNAIKAHLRTFVDSLRAVVQRRPKNQTPVQAEPIDTESRVVYLGKSRFSSDGIYLPRAQSQHAYSALERLEAQVGPIDEFVASELGYPSVEKMAKGLAGYQIDGLALAIQANKLGKGFIIGDDTGVGKGRAAAAMIVWATKNGKIPIFVTLSDSLYTAMYEDLSNIGHEDIKIGMTNNESMIQKNIGNGQTKVVFENKGRAGPDLMSYITKNGELPKGMDVLFTAYSQLNGGTGSPARQGAIASLVAAGKAVLIMDEAHNAAGIPTNPDSVGQNAFFMSLLTGQNLLGKDKDAPEDWQPPPAVYLSATFAKRPDNMPLYIHTNLRYAANTPEELTALFGKGVKTDVLQQVSSEMLVESGSMLRRERSYEGVKMDFVTDEDNAPRDIREVDKVTTILRALVNADRALKEWMKSAAVQEELIKTFAPPGSTMGKIGPTAFTEAKANMFTSVVHNYIGTLLLSTKTQTAVDMVVEKMNNNEKVVVGLQNTNGSALDDFVSKNGIKIGDEIPNFGWQTLLQRAIDSTRKVTLKSATGNKKDNIKVEVPYSMMPPTVRAGYDNLANMLKSFQSDLPVAPIDYMRTQLESKYVWIIDGKTQVGDTPPAGVKARRLVVKEITGRNTAVDYRGDVPKYMALNNPERVAMISSFQNGEDSQNGPIDVLIINSAGATGISLHASTEAFDQRPRHMIVLQPHGDISVFIQLLGRIHRTGQVEWPSFTMLATGIPAERRILAMLRKKLSSLKSNTSGGSSSTKVNGVDFINRYGDVATAEYLNEHADIREFLGQPLFGDPAEQAGTDLAHKASGTAGLLSSADQQEFFDSIEASYLAEIELRNSTGTNALERRVLPLNAEMIKENLIEEGLDSSNPFLTDVVMAQLNVDVIGSIPTKQNIDDDIAQALNGRTAQQVVEEIDTELNTIFVEVRNQIILKQQALAASIAAPEATEKDIEVLTKQKEALDLQFANLGERRERTLNALRNQYAIGTGFESFMLNNVPASSVVIGVKVDKARIGKSKTGNPYSPSNFQVIFKRNIPEGRVAPTLATLEGPSIDQSAPWRNPPLDDWFALKSVTGGRTTRYIALGNILRAAQLFDKDGGEIAKFTLMNQTEPVSGVIMPAKYQPVAISAQPVRLRNPNAAVQYTLSAWNKILQNKYDSTQMEDYKQLIDQLQPLLLPNLPDFQTFVDLQKATYTNIVIRGTQGIWTLSLDNYRPDGFRLSVAGEAPKKFVTSIKDIPMAKKGGRYEMTGRDNISDPAKVVSLIKLLHKSYPATVEADFGQLAREVMKVEFDDSESKKGMFSRTVAAGGQSVEDVKSQMVPLKGIRVNVVQSTDELPDECAPSDVEGAWYSGNTVYLVADNLPNAKRVQEVLAHEAIGHAALEAMLGKELMADLVKNVQNLEKSSRLIKQIAVQVDRTQPGLSADRRAKEIVAVMAERGLYGGLVQRVIQAVRRWLKAAGFTLKFSDSDVLALLKNAEKFAVAPDSAPKLFGTPEPFYSKNYQGGPAPMAQWSSPDSTTMTNIEYQLADKFVDLKHVIREIEKGAGEIEENFDAYTKETLMHGRASEAIQDFLNKELLPVLKKMRDMKVTLPELEEYLHNRHAEEYNIQIARINPAMPGTDETNSGSGISTDNANLYLNSLPQDQKNKFKSLAADVDAIVKGTQEVVVDGGLETQETINLWNKTYQNYVPLKRADLDYVHTGSGIARGLQTKGAFNKRAMGSLKDVVDIFSNIAIQREKAIINSEAAKVGRALYGLVITNPNPGFWMAVNPDAIKNKKKLEEELINLGINPTEAQNLFQEPKTPGIDPQTGLVKYQVNPLMRQSDNVFSIRVNGKDRFVFFNGNDPRALRMAKTIKNLESEQLGVVLGMVGSATRWMAAVNTQYNPVFGAWNFLRDVGSATINLSATPLAGKQVQVLAGTMPAMAAIYRSLRTTRKAKAISSYWVDVYDRYRHAGGKTGFKEQFSKGQNNLTIVEKELAKLDRGNARQLAAGIFNWLSDYNDTMENAVRLSAFDVATKSVSEGGLGLSEQEGAALAKDLTVNFNRKGAATKWMQTLYAFFNASVQGGLKVGRVLTGPSGRKIMIGGVVVGMVQALFMAMAGFDDDDPPEFIKAKNFIIPTGDGTYKVFPMPLGYSMFPGFGRLVTEYILAQNNIIYSNKSAADVAVDIMSMSVDAFNPFGSGSLWQMAMPTLADPFAALSANKDSFGRPIYKEDRATNPTPGYMRSRESASAVGQFIAEFLNYVSSPAGTKYTKGAISPTADEIDYLIGQATGGVGRETMKVAQYVGAIASGETEEVPTYKVPIVGKFLGETGTPASTSAIFYDNVVRLAKHENEIKQLIKNKESTVDYKAEHPEWKYFNRANYLENQISIINKQIKVAQERGRPEETIKKLKDRKTALMKKFNEQVKEVQ